MNKIDKANSFVNKFRKGKCSFLFIFSSTRRRPEKEVIDLLVTVGLADDDDSARILLENILLRKKGPEYLLRERGVIDMQAEGIRYSHKDTDYVELRKVETKKGIMYELYLSRAELYWLKVIGFSGLAVTTQGIGLLYNKFNYRERDFLRRKDGILEILDTNSQEELGSKLKKGYEYINRCKMLVTFPWELSIVWNYL